MFTLAFRMISPVYSAAPSFLITTLYPDPLPQLPLRSRVISEILYLSSAKPGCGLDKQLVTKSATTNRNEVIPFFSTPAEEDFVHLKNVQRSSVSLFGFVALVVGRFERKIQRYLLSAANRYVDLLLAVFFVPSHDRILSGRQARNSVTTIFIANRKEGM
jgi:hypothetical protein